MRELKPRFVESETGEEMKPKRPKTHPTIIATAARLAFPDNSVIGAIALERFIRFLKRKAAEKPIGGKPEVWASSLYDDFLAADRKFMRPSGLNHWRRH